MSNSLWIRAYVFLFFVASLSICSGSAHAQVPPCQIDFEAGQYGIVNQFQASVQVADLNNDGRLDVVTVSELGPVLLLNNGDETFTPSFEFPFVLGGYGDVDGDGDVDAIGGSGLCLQRNDGTGVFSPCEEIDPSIGFARGDLRDFDGDGDLDLVAVGFGTSTTEFNVSTWTNDGLGSFTSVDQFTVTAFATPIRIADLDGDGLLDVYVRPLPSSFDYSVTPILATGEFGATRVMTFEGAGSLLVGDLDGSAPDDVVAVGAGLTRVIFGDGSELELAPHAPVINGIQIMDVDDDGFNDLVEVNLGTEGSLGVRLGTGGGQFLDPIVIPGWSSNRFTSADLNQDGAPELVGSSSLRWNRTFEFEDCDGNGVPDRCDVEAEDCNGNGIPDSCDIASGEALDTNGDGIPDSCQLFQRGDTNGDGTVGISDPIRLLSVLFSGGDPLACVDAGDTNDDGAIDLADAVGLLNSLFGSAASLPEPSDSCGVDPTTDTLDCAVSQSCP